MDEELTTPPHDFIPTTLLREGMFVQLEKGSVSQVITLQIHPESGDYVIGLLNIQTNRTVIITIKGKDAYLPFWKPARGWRHGE